MSNLPTFLEPSDTFVNRHIGPGEIDVDAMLKAIGAESLDTLVDQTVPPAIRLKASLGIGHSRTESAVLADLAGIAAENRVLRSLIGMGYYDTIIPPVIQRNILENPGWYTQYTPYQAEIAQGRLEALLNFQTMIADLTGLPLANASLLDEGTACAEAMTMCRAIAAGNRTRFIVADNCHPQTIAVVRGRAEPVGIEVDVASPDAFNFTDDACGILLQYPATDGRIADYSALVKKAHDAGAVVVFATDLLALTLLKSPGEFGADIAVGSAQRFGVPLGFGGPHAAFIATHEAHARKIPGRIVGVSRDAAGRPALRLAIQTREQHIRRDKASSNICTAQVLLAIMASMYGVYHGPRGLKRIARRVHGFTNLLADSLRSAGHSVTPGALFDTLRITPKANNGSAIIADAEKQGINLRPFVDGSVGISLDERTNEAELRTLLKLFGASLTSTQLAALPADVARTSDFMTHPVFNIYHSETEMLRYIFRLQSRDLSLAQSMIPLGSCTMKLNATSEMLPITWPAFAQMHPFAPHNQTAGYRKMFAQLEDWLARVTGFAAISLQPNAGSQGEYAGLLAIRAYHRSRGDSHRDICLIPTSAHGTNPASAVVAGFKVVAVQCDEHGNVDLNDLRKRVDEHRDNVAALMITYPSTHGVFEEGVKDVCAIVHSAGGQVYMDGANMNAQVGLCRPGDIGADVCHLNLHKTFCIPHGGGGPGMGPIGVAQHLAPFLPSHPVTKPDSLKADGIPPVSAAPYGSAAILPISWVYIALMGDDGLKRATQVAILNANYMAHRLKDHYPMLYAGRNGRVAHEFILDCRSFEKSAGIKVEDIAKRLMDYGYHAPTMSFPVAGTLMIEPTESESRAELDRFCDAMISIREEIRQVEAGSLDRADNPLKHAPHSAGAIASDNWPHKYTREQAAYPMPYLRDFKFWTPVDRIDNPYGDRNLICTCTPMDEIAR